jgi:hypothetical protein
MSLSNILQTINLQSSGNGFGTSPYTSTSASSSFFTIESSQLPNTVSTISTAYTTALVGEIATSTTASGTNLVYASFVGTFVWVVQAMPAGSVGNIYMILIISPINSTGTYGNIAFASIPTGGLDVHITLTYKGKTSVSPIFNIPRNDITNVTSPYLGWQVTIPLSNLFPDLSLINCIYQFEITFLVST